MTAAQVAERTGFSAAKVSRYETGRIVPSAKDAETFARAVRASAADRKRVVALAKDVRESAETRLVLLRPGSGGARRMQDRIARIEKQSHHVGTFANTIVPGLLQTAEYMRYVFRSADLPPDEVEEATASRLARQAQAREPASRCYTQLVTEGALTWQVGNPDVMARQIERIAELAQAGGDQFRVGVIPMAQPVEEFPLQAFDLYDARAVLMGTHTATAFMTQPTDVQAYSRLFEALAGRARFGVDALPTLERIADEYRALPR